MIKGPFHRPQKRQFIIDHGRVEDIPRSKAIYQQILKYYWDRHSENSFQRSQIHEELKASLRDKASRPFPIDHWQRAVKYRFSLDPLSARGSLLDPGGRLNIGAIDPSRYTPFPALYLAFDKDTALDEIFGRGKKKELLSYEELALSRAESVAVVSVSGSLDTILDLREPSNLSGFVALTKNFSTSKALLEESRRLGQGTPKIADTVSTLVGTILATHWRFMPMQWDVPANSQLFGQIVMDAGIEGIVYPSSLTGHDCIAVFPQNFANSSSFLQIDDPLPDLSVKNRFDKDTYKGFI